MSGCRWNCLPSSATLFLLAPGRSMLHKEKSSSPALCTTPHSTCSVVPVTMTLNKVSPVPAGATSLSLVSKFIVQQLEFHRGKYASSATLIPPLFVGIQGPQGCDKYSAPPTEPLRKRTNAGARREIIRLLQTPLANISLIAPSYRRILSRRPLPSAYIPSPASGQ